MYVQGKPCLDGRDPVDRKSERYGRSTLGYSTYAQPCVYHGYFNTRTVPMFSYFAPFSAKRLNIHARDRSFDPPSERGVETVENTAEQGRATHLSGRSDVELLAGDHPPAAVGLKSDLPGAPRPTERDSSN